MKAVIMVNDLFASLRTYLNKVTEGERTPAELANALNTWVKQSGDVLKSKIDEEVLNTVTRMGFIKRDEFEQLRAEFNEFRSSAKISSMKTTPSTPKKTTVKKATIKKSASQKKRKS